MATQLDCINAFRGANRQARQLYIARDFSGAQGSYVSAVGFYNMIDGKEVYADELRYTQEIMGIPGSDATPEGVAALSDPGNALSMNISGEVPPDQASAINDSVQGDKLVQEGLANQPSGWDSFVGDTFSDAGPVGGAITKSNEGLVASQNAIGLGNLAPPPQSGRDIVTEKNGKDLGGKIGLSLGVTTVVIVTAVGVFMLFYARSIRLI